MSALLSLDRVSKRFRGLVAVDAVSFDVPEGVIFAVIGPNGAGKTTLFNLIAGAMAPDDGAIAFAGAPIGGLTPDAVCRRGVARTFQLVRPFPALSVEDNVIIGGIGTLFGPILGAFVLTGLAESVTSAMAAFGFDLPGAKQIFYGVCLLLVVVALPEGIWPSLARRLGVGERER